MDVYFNRMLKYGSNIISVMDGRVVSTVTIFDCILKGQSQYFPIGYLFCLLTDEDYRGRGLATELLEYAYMFAKKRGMAAVTLIPRDEPLFGFYSQRGFNTEFYINKTVITDSQGLDIDSINRKDRFKLLGWEKEPSRLFSSIHRDRFKLAWPKGMCSHFVMDSAASGGGILYSGRNGQYSVMSCFGRKRKNTVIVKDFCVKEGLHENALKNLCGYFPGCTYEIYTPEDVPVCGYQVNKVPYGMIKPIGTLGEKLCKALKNEQKPAFYSPLVD